MGSKRRRLKRYLGLKRDGDGGHYGGIEHLLPGRLSGWVFGASEPFHEVRLLVGAHLIARAEVDQSRPDACNLLGREGTPGFSLALPAELPPLDWSQTPRVLALSSDGQRQAELKLIGKTTTDTIQKLTTLLQCDVLGLDGHCDGLVAGQLQGWAARRNQTQPAHIWLNAFKQEPIRIECNLKREGMCSLAMPDQCGFKFNLHALPESWSGQSLWCSFDKDGSFHLPQEVAVTAPELTKCKEIVKTSAGYYEQMATAPTNLQSHWQALEDFRLFLDGLEQELNRRDEINGKKAQRILTATGFLQRLLGRVR